MKNIFGLDGTFGSCNMQDLTLNYMAQRNEDLHFPQRFGSIG